MNINLDTNIIDVTHVRMTTVHPKDSIKTAETIFSQIDRSVLPVVVNGALRGILLKADFQNIRKTNNNLLKYYDKKYAFGEMTVEDYMIRNYKVLDINSSLLGAIRFFKANRQYYIPIVEESRLIGLVTPYDVFNYILEQVES